MRTLRHRESKQLAWSHATGKRWSKIQKCKSNFLKFINISKSETFKTKTDTFEQVVFFERKHIRLLKPWKIGIFSFFLHFFNFIREKWIWYNLSLGGKSWYFILPLHWMSRAFESVWILNNLISCFPQMYLSQTYIINTFLIIQFKCPLF